MAYQLLKLWDSWVDGAGFPIDDGQRKGFYGPGATATSSFIGLLNELKVVPGQVNTAIGVDQTAEYSFDVANPTAGRNIYFLGTQDSSASDTVQKLRLYDNGGPTFTDEGSKTDLTATAYSFGQPAYYRGNWYFTQPRLVTAPMQKLTTSANGNISTDTFATGNASSGGGHLAIIGHQLAKFNKDSGVSYLTTAADATDNANWGAYFAVGEISQEALAVRGLGGMAFALRQNGLWSFNDRGKAAQLYESETSVWVNGIFSGAPLQRSMTPWLGGIVYVTPDGGLAYFTPGSLPVNIGLQARPVFKDRLMASGLTPRLSTNGCFYRQVIGVGDYLYASWVGGSTYLILAGQARNGNPLDIAWNVIGACNLSTFHAAYSDDLDCGYLITPGGSTFSYQPIGNNGDPSMSAVNSGATGVAVAPSAAEALMSELRFSPAIRPSKIVVFPKNMISGDYMYLKAYINNRAVQDVGGRLYDNKPQEITIPYAEDVFALTLALEFATSDTTTLRAAMPSVYRMELWGEG